MALIAAGAGGAALAAASYMYSTSRAKPDPEEEEDLEPEYTELVDEEPEMVSEADLPSEAAALEGSVSWKKSAGRDYGRDGYVFGDVTRGMYSRVFGSSAEAQAEEEAQQEKATQVQRLVRDAVQVYRSRGYNGTIAMSHTVGYFTETCTVKVEPLDSAASVDTDAEAAAVCEDVNALGNSRAGRVLDTLIARLERRAKKWKEVEKSLNSIAGIDPTLGASAQIGFAVPIIRVGWGVSISLSISQSTLLEWAAKRDAMLAAAKELSLLDNPAEETAESPAEEAEEAEEVEDVEEAEEAEGTEKAEETEEAQEAAEGHEAEEGVQAQEAQAAEEAEVWVATYPRP